MSLLPPQYYIPSNISSSFDEIQVTLKCVPSQFPQLYSEKSSCDFVLRFLEKQYFVHQGVLQKTSNLLIPGFMIKNGAKWQIDVKAKGKVINKLTQGELFVRILKCIYGFRTKIRRYDVHQAYDIAKALQIPELLNLLYNDMVSNFDQYDIFPLLKLATNQRLQQLIDLCYDQLEIQMYEPMRYNKSGLFLCEVQLFKNIIKRHNLRKLDNEKFGLSSHEVESLISEYCFVNGLKSEVKGKLIEEIMNQKQKMKNHMPFMQLVRKPSTPEKSKSTSEIFYRPTLTLPRQKDQDKVSEDFLTIRRLSPCVNQFKKVSEELKCGFLRKQQQIQFLETSLSSIKKSKISDKSNSLSNTSTENMSQQNRSRRESQGSIEVSENLRDNGLILETIENQRTVKKSQDEMKNRANQVLRKMSRLLESSRQNGTRLYKYESFLQQIKGQIVGGKQKIKELGKAVQEMEDSIKKIQMKEKFDKLFEVSVPLDLTLSRQFNLKEVLKV